MGIQHSTHHYITHLPSNMAEPLPQLFGVVPTGAPCITVPTSAPSQTSFVYILPTGPKPFSHIVVFLLPGITLPPSTLINLLSTLPTPSSTNIQVPRWNWTREGERRVQDLRPHISLKFTKYECRGWRNCGSRYGCR